MGYCAGIRVRYYRVRVVVRGIVRENGEREVVRIARVRRQPDSDLGYFYRTSTGTGELLRYD